MTVAEHLVASTRNRERTLIVPERAAWLWDRLRAAIPDALSASLMPDHVHLLAPGKDRRARFRQVLTNYSIRWGTRFDVLPAQPATSHAIAFRMARYVLLNPVRDQLVEDPWAWPWSTLRDLGGAAHPTWTTTAWVARKLRRPSPRLAVRLSSSAELKVEPPARGARPLPRVDLLELAVASALRVARGDVRSKVATRRLLIQASHLVCPPAAEWVASEVGCSARTVRRLRTQRAPGLDAVERCLADARLLVDPDAVAPSTPALLARPGQKRGGSR